jgi:signal transduction histidine kinase
MGVDRDGDDVLRELDALRREVAALHASRRRVAVANDADRRTLERALHAGVQQQLVGLAADVELAAGFMDADPDALKSLLTEMRRDVLQAVEDAQKLARQIYPTLLEAGGLRAALRSAAASASVPIRIDVDEPMACPLETASAVYFCCLDVIESAGAGTPMAVTVRKEEEALTFDVVVDRGLAAEWLPLRDRVEALGGRLTLPQGAGNETRVTGSLPLSG